MRENLPLIVFATLGGLILILRGRRWSKMIVGRVEHCGARGYGVWRFVVSLLRIVFPLVVFGCLPLLHAQRLSGRNGAMNLCDADTVLGRDHAGLALGVRAGIFSRG